MSRPWAVAGIILGGLLVAAFVVVVVGVAIHQAERIREAARRGDEAKIRITRGIMREVEQMLDLFNLDHGAYPERLEDLVKAPNYVIARNYPPNGYLNEPPMDAWDQKLIYRRGDAGGKPYELISYGADGREGGEGAAKDIVK